MSIDPDHLPEGEEKVRAVRTMFDTIAPRYDLVNRIMTLRLDTRWRRRTVRTLDLATGSTVIDLACGTGDFCVDLEKAGMRPIGYDLSAGMLYAARTNAPLVHADILRLPLPAGSVDGATCGFALRNLVELPAFFDELARVLRPGARIGLLDVAVPRNRALRWGHAVYFGKVVPRIGALLSDKDAYAYLPRSVAYLPDSATMLADLKSAGFVDVQLELMPPGAAQLISATRARGSRTEPEPDREADTDK
jgi:demethylmenaquinone methyltransferase/2-methoxy-6-polyprenyl-1,4-benzoquinol methylase